MGPVPFQLGMLPAGHTRAGSGAGAPTGAGRSEAGAGAGAAAAAACCAPAGRAAAPSSATMSAPRAIEEAMASNGHKCEGPPITWARSGRYNLQTAVDLLQAAS